MPHSQQFVVLLSSPLLRRWCKSGGGVKPGGGGTEPEGGGAKPGGGGGTKPDQQLDSKTSGGAKKNSGINGVTISVFYSV